MFLNRKKAATVVKLVFITSVGSLSFIGNILIIVVIGKTKHFRQSQYVFKTSIAVSDVIWAVLLCIDSAKLIHRYVFTTHELHCLPILSDKISYEGYEAKNFDCLPIFLPSIFDGIVSIFITFFLRKTSLMVSLISLVFAAADRYFAIAFPLKFKKTNTVKIAKVLSIIIWILSLFITIITVFTSMFNQAIKPINSFLQPSDCKNPNHIFESGLLFLLFGLLWIFTLLTLKSLHKSYKGSLKLNRVVRTKFLAEKQMSLVLIFMVVAFTFSLSTTMYHHIRYYVLELYNVECYNSETKLNLSLYFLSTNSIWNILIYNLINKKFRLALKALFKKQR